MRSKIAFQKKSPNKSQFFSFLCFLFCFIICFLNYIHKVRNFSFVYPHKISAFIFRDFYVLWLSIVYSHFERTLSWLLFCVCMYVACTCLCVDTHAVALVWRSEDDTECWSSLPTLFETRSLYYPLLYMQTSWGSQDPSVSTPQFTIEESGLQMQRVATLGP